MGGDYSESNIIEVTPTQHAMWHWANYFLYGDVKDKIAATGLAGCIGKDEIIKEILSENGKRNSGALNAHPNTNSRRSENAKRLNQHPNTVENRSKRAKVHKDASCARMNSHPNTIANRTLCASKTNSQRWRCLVTGYTSTPGNVSRHQQKLGIDKSLRERIK